MKRRLPLVADTSSHSAQHPSPAFEHSGSPSSSPSKRKLGKVLQPDQHSHLKSEQDRSTQQGSPVKQQQHHQHFQPACHMHLATANPISTRVVTRSKSKADGAAEARREALGASDAAHQHNTPGLAGITDLHALKPAALSTQQVPGHHAALLSSTAAKRAAATAAALLAPAAPAGRLHAALSDDLQHLLDKPGHQQLIAAATAAASRLTHPSLLRHTGIASNSKHGTADATAAAGTSALPPLRKHMAGSPASHSTGRGEHSTSSSSGGSSRQASSTGRATAAAAGHATASSKRSSTGSSRRVSFAPGPLQSSQAVRSPVTNDGHPATEGALAMPVRRVSSSYALDLTRGNVLMLEQLLGPESAMSVARLKRRVGLLPPIRPPRPHVCSRPAGSSWYEDDDDEEEDEDEVGAIMAAGAAAAAAATSGAGVPAGSRVPGRARSMPGVGSRAASASTSQ